MEIHRKTITVSLEDLDELNHVNNVRYVHWVNEIAKEHWHLKTDEALRERYFWVMISHTITYKSSAILNDIILVKTFVTQSEGVTSTRVVEMYNAETDKLLARSETTWCFMDGKTKRPIRIPEFIISLFA